MQLNELRGAILARCATGNAYLRTGLRWRRCAWILLAGAVACTPATSAPTSVPKPAAVLLKIGIPGVAGVVQAPVHAADDLGIFAKNGLRVEMTDYSSGSAAQEALAAGEADIIHYFPPGIAIAVSKGVKEKIIATDQYKPTDWQVIVSTKSAIQAPKDLAGRKVGVTAKGSTTEFFALWLAQKTGVTFDIVPLGGPALYPALISGQIDAAVLFPPIIYQGLDKGEIRTAFDFGKDMDPTLPSALAASDKILTEQPDAVRRYLKSVYQSIAYMQQNPEYCATFIAKHTNQERAVAERSCANTVAQLSKDGQIKQEWLENSLSLAKLGGPLELPPLQQFFSTQFTPVKLD